MDIEQVATEFYAAFVTDTRANGARFLRLKDGSPEWMTDAVHAAHGDMMPEDWRYQMTKDAAYIISENGDDEDADEALDGDVAIYTADLLSWLAGDVSRTSYVDDAVAEYGWPKGGLCQALQMGQLAERREVYELLRAALRERAEETADAEE